MTSPCSILQLSEELCRSSIEENTSFSTGEEEEIKIKKTKVAGRMYSRLAFNVKRLPRDDADDGSVESMDSSLSSHDIFHHKTCVLVFDERRNRSNLGRGKKIMKRVFEKKSLNDAALAEDCPQNCGNLNNLVKKDSRKKSSRSRYSKLAFSVQQAGTVKEKKKKKKKTQT